MNSKQRRLSRREAIRAFKAAGAALAKMPTHSLTIDGQWKCSDLGPDECLDVLRNWGTGQCALAKIPIVDIHPCAVIPSQYIKLENTQAPLSKQPLSVRLIRQTVGKPSER